MSCVALSPSRIKSGSPIFTDSPSFLCQATNTPSSMFQPRRGTVIGTLIGAVIVGVFRNGLTLIGVQVIYQYLVTGILVILAVSVDQLTHRRRL